MSSFFLDFLLIFLNSLVAEKDGEFDFERTVWTWDARRFRTWVEGEMGGREIVLYLIQFCKLQMAKQNSLTPGLTP